MRPHGEEQAAVHAALPHGFEQREGGERPARASAPIFGQGRFEQTEGSSGAPGVAVEMRPLFPGTRVFLSEAASALDFFPKLNR